MAVKPINSYTLPADMREDFESYLEDHPGETKNSVVQAALREFLAKK